VEDNLEILQSMFERYFSSGGQSSNIDFKIIALDSGARRIFVNLKFKNGEFYCCGELTCHFKPNWRGIKEIALDNNLELLSPLSIECNVLIESGAKLRTNISVGLALSSEQYQYVEVFSE
jgi:hypothetical protein